MEDLLNGPRLDPDAMHTLALTELKLGRPQEAIQYLERALDKFPKHLASSVTLASTETSSERSQGCGAGAARRMSEGSGVPEPYVGS